jgi:hypothetical protein
MRRLTRWGLLVLLVLISTGWLVPLSAAVEWLLRWCENEQMNAHGQHSFPYLAAARDAFTVAGWWLGLVVLSWSVAAGRLWMRKATTGGTTAPPGT